MTDAFHLGQFAVDDLLHAIAVDQVNGTYRVNPLAVRILTRDGILLHDVAETDDDEGQGYAQADEFNGGVELVSGKEFQVGFHSFKLRKLIHHSLQSYRMKK